ncbi:MAG: hypothetical protein GOVbin568_26 [Prokaryotic dsDNA virus sp.]|nr:MAG: hypothetical protein GOVbin568_26 [Prokaryotic dsDNA virus sp.]|tara:strand:+ start:198 stop:404 length:207 start_codon:yes stop_codon:yes gene_type:complete
MVTKKQIAQAKVLYKACKSGVAPDNKTKKQLVELYNEIHQTRYRPTTNCGSCLHTVFDGIKKIALQNE